uniref:C2H2-type domain-containing protein n=1 Tax=Nothobranchius kadleci TaxID=1051664 RepID=A0A1A8EBZ9_NOTKA
MFPVDVQQMLVMKEEDHEEWRSDEDQQDHELVIIKKEEEEIWTSEKNEHIDEEETDATRFSFASVLLKQEEDGEKPPLSHIYRHKVEDRDLLTSCSADQMKVESGRADCRRVGSTRNLDLNTHGEESNSSENDEDEVNNHDSQLKPLADSESQTEDSDGDLTDGRTTGPAVNTTNCRCSECGKLFVSNRSLQRHVTSHSRSPSVNNNKSFTVEVKVESIKKVRKRRKSFHCDDCGKNFTRKTNLNAHKTVHTGEKPFACHMCRQSFNRKGNLNTHMGTHTGQKPFGCDVCGQRFSQKITLDKHMMIHTGQKPFACDFCGLSFSQKATLSRHIKVHTGDKQFVCDVCEQRFSRKAHLTTHVRTHS